MKGILWNGGLRLQRIGLSDAEPPPSPLFYCSGGEIFRFAVILWNPNPCKAVVEEGSEKRLCTSQEHRKYLLKARSVSPCVNIPGVHVRGCQHLYGLWMKEAACSELGTPARQHWAWQAQQTGCCLVPAPQKKESGFLATERFMTCDWNFYLNPENRTGLILISQETAAGGGAGRHQLSVGSSFSPFPSSVSLAKWPPAAAASATFAWGAALNHAVSLQRAVASAGEARAAAGRAAALLQYCSRASAPRICGRSLPRRVRSSFYPQFNCTETCAAGFSPVLASY